MAKPAPQPQALPKPDARVTPTADEFSAWCQHPVTRYVAAAWEVAARQQREEWARVSWRPGLLSPLERDQLEHRRVELTTAADAYSAFLETGLERYVELNTQDQ
jgi:hypothetical protein